MSLLRVAYAGDEFFSSCLKALAERTDTRLVLCLTSDPEHAAGSVLELASSYNIPVLFGRPSGHAIATINESDVDLLVCGAYLYRIPIEQLTVRRAVNIHPTLLPDGRGPNPLPYLVDGRSEYCGISLHEMTAKFDRGPVLLQERIELEKDDGYDELAIKLLGAAPRLVSRFLDDIDNYWQARRPQGPGSYWPRHTEDERTVVAAEVRVSEVKAIHRKFGIMGVIIRLEDGTRLEARRLTASRCEHNHRPGSLVAKLSFGWIVAVVDGLIRLEDPDVMAPS